MKQKDLLQKWEQVKGSYLSYFDRDELEKEYSDWFGNSIDHYPYMEKSQMIEELIADQLEYRKDDSIDDLKETIKNIKSLSVI
tara:strand:+ start:9152 stop:9400 length:249 start_codon:yes stop_codon:yes gene_type:complete